MLCCNAAVFLLVGAFLICSSCDAYAFVPCRRHRQHASSSGRSLQQHIYNGRGVKLRVNTSQHALVPQLDLITVLRMASANGEQDQPSSPPANLVSKDAYVRAIEVLKESMNVPPESPEEAAVPKMYAIGRLDANLPIELAGGISLADCETLTLVNGLTQQVADETGIQPLDTIVGISAGVEGDDGKSEGGEGYSGDTTGADLDATAAVYTAAIEYAMANELKVITLEMNRLVTLKATSE